MPAVTLVICLVVAPALLLVTYSFRETTFIGVGPGPTLDQFRSLTSGSWFFPIALRTVRTGMAVGAVVTLFAFTMSYGIRFRFKPRAGLVVLGIVLAAGIASFFVRIFAWGTILGKNGLLNRALEFAHVTSGPVDFLFYSQFAVITTMAYLYLPLGIAVMYGAMQDVDLYSTEAGRDLGAGRWRTATQVVAPQVRGALWTTFILTTILASADYVTPALVGGTKGMTIGVVIRDRALSSSDLPGSAATTLAYLVLLFAALTLLALVLRGGGFMCRMAAPSANRHASRLARLTPSTWACVSLSRVAVIALAIYLVAPTVVVLVFSLNDSSTLGLPWQGFTLRWYPQVLTRPGLGDAIRTSVILALVGSVGALVIGTAASLAIARAGARSRKLLMAAMILPMVVPGILIGLGLLALTDLTGLPLGMRLTALAHVVLLLPIVVAVATARLSMLNPELDQAARDLGSSPWRAFRTVTLPLIAPSLVASFLICIAVSMDEIMVTTFTIGTGGTLPTWVLGRARIGFDPGLNALGVMLVVTTLIVPGLGYAAVRAWSRRRTQFRDQHHRRIS